ncbi:hypothetical protein H257_12022 [Aphanomyces astaci]|uniref:Uncharacterized protein n=1 Tax=Aphanomyces astaci TaxID=112090 RepID=W4G0K4_APHAT|nr:hypothetical protein H257_12022 [Aphanomyces astaci]ETV73220.1 hypothetical protein H257_12022 [Aphanomyces astaci]|eukprot:XP_009837425.1 hypothetical protein H257_12022 [Aphanomyces astaci]
MDFKDEDDQLSIDLEDSSEYVQVCTADVLQPRMHGMWRSINLRGQTLLSLALLSSMQGDVGSKWKTTCGFY